MAKGLIFKVASGELKLHLIDRASYNVQRAEEKEAVLPELREVERVMSKDIAKSTLNKMSTSNYNFNPADNVESLEQDILRHRTKAHSFMFMAEHLFDEFYELNTNDLVTLELVKNY